jgi:hypothetical protein
VVQVERACDVAGCALGLLVAGRGNILFELATMPWSSAGSADRVRGQQHQEFGGGGGDPVEGVLRCSVPSRRRGRVGLGRTRLGGYGFQVGFQAEARLELGGMGVVAVA